MAGENREPGVGKEQMINGSLAIQAELAAHWSYALIIPNVEQGVVAGAQQGFIRLLQLANEHPQWPLEASIIRANVRRRASNSSSPDHRALRAAPGQESDRSHLATGRCTTSRRPRGRTTSRPSSRRTCRLRATCRTRMARSLICRASRSCQVQPCLNTNSWGALLAKNSPVSPLKRGTARTRLNVPGKYGLHKHKRLFTAAGGEAHGCPDSLFDSDGEWFRSLDANLSPRLSALLSPFPSWQVLCYDAYGRRTFHMAGPPSSYGRFRWTFASLAAQRNLTVPTIT